MCLKYFVGTRSVVAINSSVQSKLSFHLISQFAIEVKKIFLIKNDIPDKIFCHTTKLAN